MKYKDEHVPVEFPPLALVLIWYPDVASPKVLL